MINEIYFYDILNTREEILNFPICKRIKNIGVKTTKRKWS